MPALGLNWMVQSHASVSTYEKNREIRGRVQGRRRMELTMKKNGSERVCSNILFEKPPEAGNLSRPTRIREMRVFLCELSWNSHKFAHSLGRSVDMTNVLWSTDGIWILKYCYVFYWPFTVITVSLQRVKFSRPVFPWKWKKCEYRKL